MRPELTHPLPLTWTSRKALLLEELGVDATVVYPTNRALLELTAEEFFQQIIVDALDAKAIVEGPNFAFGKDRAGTIDVLRQLCEANAVELIVVEPL